MINQHGVPLRVSMAKAGLRWRVTVKRLLKMSMHHEVNQSAVFAGVVSCTNMLNLLRTRNCKRCCD